jgi:hypothetical protein
MGWSLGFLGSLGNIFSSRWLDWSVLGFFFVFCWQGTVSRITTSRHQKPKSIANQYNIYLIAHRVNVILLIYNDPHINIIPFPFPRFPFQPNASTRLYYIMSYPKVIQSQCYSLNANPKCKSSNLIYAYLKVGCQLGAGGFHLPFWSQPALLAAPLLALLALPFAPRISVLGGSGGIEFHWFGRPRPPQLEGGTFCAAARAFMFFLLLMQLTQHERMAMITSPPITDARAITNVLLLWIQLLISLPTLESAHTPLAHFPPP